MDKNYFLWNPSLLWPQPERSGIGVRNSSSVMEKEKGDARGTNHVTVPADRVFGKGLLGTKSKSGSFSGLFREKCPLQRKRFMDGQTSFMMGIVPAEWTLPAVDEKDVQSVHQMLVGKMQVHGDEREQQFFADGKTIVYPRIFRGGSVLLNFVRPRELSGEYLHGNIEDSLAPTKKMCLWLMRSMKEQMRRVFAAALAQRYSQKISKEKDQIWMGVHGPGTPPSARTPDTLDGYDPARPLTHGSVMRIVRETYDRLVWLDGTVIAEPNTDAPAEDPSDPALTRVARKLLGGIQKRSKHPHDQALVAAVGSEQCGAAPCCFHAGGELHPMLLFFGNRTQRKVYTNSVREREANFEGHTTQSGAFQHLVNALPLPLRKELSLYLWGYSGDGLQSMVGQCDTAEARARLAAVIHAVRNGTFLKG